MTSGDFSPGEPPDVAAHADETLEPTPDLSAEREAEVLRAQQGGNPDLFKLLLEAQRAQRAMEKIFQNPATTREQREAVREAHSAATAKLADYTQQQRHD